MKRLNSLFVLSSLVFGLFIPISNANSSDTGLPVMVQNSGVFPKTSYTPGEDLTFTYRITDDVGCCSYNVVSLWQVSGRNPAGSPPYSSSNTAFVSGSSMDGVYSATISLPISIAPGLWYVKAQARDYATWYTHVEDLGTISISAAVPTPTPTPTATSTPAPIPTSTGTPAPTATSTPAPTATTTPAPTATSTPAPSSSPKPSKNKTPLPIKTKTPEPVIVEDETLYEWEQINYTEYVPLPKKVSGIVREDSVFLRSNSPFTISRTVQIAEGVTVYIEAGTVIKISTGIAFQVKGNLVVEGTLEKPVIFTGKPNAYFSLSKSPKSSRIDINYAKFDGGKSFLPPSGNESYGTLTLRNSQITNVPGYSYIWYPADQVIIEGNVFRSSGGFSVGFDGRNEDPDYSINSGISFKNNLFIGKPATGYWIEVWASYGSQVEVINNSFVNGPYTAVAIREGHDNAFLDASENYWGTSQVGAITKMIRDSNDDLDYQAEIPFDDWLTKPHPMTPTKLLFK